MVKSRSELSEFFFLIFRGMRTSIAIIFLLWVNQLKAQDIKLLFEQDSFEQIKSLEEYAAEMDGESLYILGMSFYYTDDFQKSYRYLQSSIDKGFAENQSYRALAVTCLQLKKYVESRTFIREAIKLSPNSQLNFSMLANSFYYEKNLDSALHYFYVARDLDYETGEPYMSVPHIYHVKKDYTKALEEYYKGIELQPQVDEYYTDMLKEIGILEYAINRNFDKSANAFYEYLAYMPQDHEVQIKLIKTWNAMNDVKQADSLFSLIKANWVEGRLPEAHQNRGSIAVDEFEWNDRTVLIFRKFKEPEEVLEIKYLIYILDEKGDKVDRVLQTEKTFGFGDNSIEHILCEWTKDRVHLNYGIGWRTEDMTVPSVRKTVLHILEEKRGAAAGRRIGGKKGKKKNK